MKNRIMKKALSLVLVFVMTVSCFNAISFESKASENVGYKELTYSDITREQFQEITNLDKTAFTVKATFKDGGYFRIGGNNDGNGWTDTLGVSYINNINNSGNKAIYFSWIKGTASTSVSTNTDAVYPSNVAVEQEMLLRLTFDVDGENLLINTYVNGVWYKESTIKAVAPYMGTRIVWSNVTLKSVNTDYKELTYSDITREQFQGVTTLDKTAFTVKATFKDGGYFRIGGNNDGNGWTDTLGVSYINNINNSGNKAIYFSWIKGTASTSVSTNTDAVYPSNVAVEQEMLLRLTFDVDGENLLINTYVNGVWYKESAIKAVAPYMGSRIVWSNVTMKSVVIGSSVQEPGGNEGGNEGGQEPQPEPQPIEQKTPEELGYTCQVLLADFELAGGEYSSTSASGNHHFGAHSDLATLSNTYLDVYLTFEDVENIAVDNSLRYCSTSGWHGIQIGLGGSELQIFTTRNKAAGHSYDKDALGLTTLKERFNLKLGVKIGEDKGDGTCDITYDLWINDVRVVAAAVLENATLNDIGAGLGIYTPSGTMHVTSPEVEEEPIEQKTPEQLGYTQVRLRDFMLADGTYSPEHKNGNHHFNASEFSTLSGTYLDVNMTFKDQDAIAFDNSLRLASTQGWKGIQIGLTGGQLKICNAADRKGDAYSKENLGLTTFEESFNLKLGIQIGEDNGDGTCDITYDLWINNVRVAAEAVLKGVSISDIGTGLGIYTPSGSMILTSPDSVNTDGDTAKETLPSSFRKVTFHNFGVNNGTFNYNGGKLCFYGDYALNLNKTIFSGDVYYSHTKGGDFRYGGKTNEWCGLWFYTRSDGKLYMRGVEGDTGTYVFNPVIAGTELTDTWFNIKLSTEYVDSDNDGNKDDIKLGVWFNDVLYDNTYIYLKDYAQYFGNYFSIFVDNSDSFIALKNDESIDRGVDFTLFGCTKNWAKEIGL